MTCWARWWCNTLPTELRIGPFASYCFLFLSVLPPFASLIIIYLVSHRQKKKKTQKLHLSPRSHSETPTLYFLLFLSHLHWSINNMWEGGTFPLPGHWCQDTDAWTLMPKSPILVQAGNTSKYVECLQFLLVLIPAFKYRQTLDHKPELLMI